MKKIISMAIVIFSLCSCGSPDTEYPPEEQHNVVIKGDSMAAGVHLDMTTRKVVTTEWWTALKALSVANEGVSGAPIELIRPDTVYHEVVILFAGYNNIKHNYETVDDILKKYSQVLAGISSDKTICIGVPFMEKEKSSAWYPAGDWITEERIQSVNDGIKAMCPLYIDVSDVKTVDGIHPEYELIINRLNGVL